MKKGKTDSRIAFSNMDNIVVVLSVVVLIVSLVYSEKWIVDFTNRRLLRGAPLPIQPIHEEPRRIVRNLLFIHPRSYCPSLHCKYNASSNITILV